MEQDVREFRYHHDAVSLRWSAVTHVGMRRQLNEDSFDASFPVFLVADGMGGHAAGDRASTLALSAFERLHGRSLPEPCRVETALERSFAAVLGSGDTGAGTTLTGAIVTSTGDGIYWYLVNVGDSRTYLLQDGVLRQLSVDHSVVQEMIEAGEVTREDARRHPLRNVITRSIGGGQVTPPDTWLTPVQRNQRLLVCSDGLSGELDDEVLARVLRSHPSPAHATAELLRLALAAGARDNVSAVVVDVDAVDQDDTGWQDTDLDLVFDTVPRGGRP